MSNVELARMLEYTPRLLQIARMAHLSGSLAQKELFPGSYIEEACKTCGLTAVEADVDVLSLPSPGRVLLRFSHPSLYVEGEYELHIMALRYLRVRDARILAVYQTEKEYTPCVLRGSIGVYDDAGNAEAYLYAPNALTLEDRVDGVLYEYPLADVGSKIYPVVSESYIVRIIL
jgi:hypothetical protein